MTSLLQQRPLLRPEVVLAPPSFRGPTPVYLVVDSRTGRCFELGARERFLLGHLDGARSLEEIGDDYLEAFGRPIGERGWVQLLGLLFGRDLLVPAPGAPPMPRPAPPAPAPRSSDVRVGRWVIAPTTTLIARLHERTQAVFRPVAQWPLLTAILAMEITVATHLSDMWQSLPSLWGNPVTVVAVVLFLWLSLSLHEIAHGVTARHFGGDAPEIGLLFRPPLVFLYCRVDGAALQTSRRYRVATAAAGAWMNLVVLLPVYGWWLALPEPAGELGNVLSGLLLVGSVTGLVNYVPLPPLDGYAMLGHGLGILDLGRGSTRCVLDSVRALTGRSAVHYPRRLRAIYLGYALLRAGSYLVLAAVVVHYCRVGLPAPWGTFALASLTAFVVAAAAARVTRRPVPAPAAAPVPRPEATADTTGEHA
jgi:putative peptide zinc metalloprotease protein